MKVGNVEIRGRALLAPMAGVTDIVFRRICAEMGAALTYTEMVSAKGLLYTPERSETLLAGAGVLKPAAMQLFGNEPELMADMALEHGGGYDIIDINMGCPVPKIVRAGQGSALMAQPDWAAHIVSTLSRRTGKPVTVKIRKGWDERHVNAVEFALRMQDAGAAAVAVHGRTREQFYSGKADWNIVRLVREALTVPVIGSGDVHTAQDAHAMLNETGCDAVIAARGAQGNPWLFREFAALEEGRVISPPSLAERLDVARQHASELTALKGEKIAVQQMRKHLGWYIKGIPNAATWRERINSVNTMEQINELLELITNSCLPL